MIFNGHNEENYKAIILMVVAVINFGAYYEGETIIINYILLFKISLIALLYFLIIKIPSHKSKKALRILGVIVAITFVIFGGLMPIAVQLKAYILKDVSKEEIFYFYGVRSTVNEVENANFMKFVLESSGHLFIFICAVGGLALLLIKFRSFILILPMIALGVLALFGGTRFTMYATPMIALGFAYFIYFTLNYFEIRTWLRSTLLAILTCLAIMPSIDFIYEFRVAPTLTKDSIMPLAELKNKASREDYVLSWWDYGYLIRYYSDVKVVADPGGRQAGEYTFMSAFSFNKDEVSSANMARLNVEYIQKLQGKKFDPKLEDKFKLNLYQIQKDYGEADINKFLSSLSDKNFKLPQKTRDIYYYFVPKMIDILPNIWKFTSIDIASGEKFTGPLAYVGYDIQIGKDGKSIILGEGVELPSVKPEYVVHNGEKLSINSYYQVGEVNGELKKISKQIDTKSNIYVIFLPNYQRILILDKKVFESAFIQLFVLENYDKDLFEPVYLSNSARIYKL